MQINVISGEVGIAILDTNEDGECFNKSDGCIRHTLCLIDSTGK